MYRLSKKEQLQGQTVKPARQNMTDDRQRQIKETDNSAQKLHFRVRGKLENPQKFLPDPDTQPFLPDSQPILPEPQTFLPDPDPQPFLPRCGSGMYLRLPA